MSSIHGKCVSAGLFGNPNRDSDLYTEQVLKTADSATTEDAQEALTEVTEVVDELSALLIEKFPCQYDAGFLGECESLSLWASLPDTEQVLKTLPIEKVVCQYADFEPSLSTIINS
ncbi:MAG TPA: hypothetical protein P5048_04705, partial [Chlamydiales bacterium]|nr:hypothetical protein [Chlamydiales bacterium]